MCVSGFVLFCLDVLEGGPSSWPELNSQGVYHGLSAKKTDSCLQGGARGQAGTLAPGRTDRGEVPPPRQSHPRAFVRAWAPALFSPALDQCRVSVCTSPATHEKNSSSDAWQTFTSRGREQTHGQGLGAKVKPLTSEPLPGAGVGRGDCLRPVLRTEPRGCLAGDGGRWPGCSVSISRGARDQLHSCQPTRTRCKNLPPSCLLLQPPKSPGGIWLRSPRRERGSSWLAG